VADGNEELRQFDTSCFSGEYITGVDSGFLEQQQSMRSDDAKSKRRSA
jgi:amidophosphoribosyltransferase